MPGCNGCARLLPSPATRGLVSTLSRAGEIRRPYDRARYSRQEYLTEGIPVELWVFRCPVEDCAHVALFDAGTHDSELEVTCPHCPDDEIMDCVGQTSLPLTVSAL